jgi:hypothetical protein
MKEIHLGLPYSLPLRDILPHLADPLAGQIVGLVKMQARVRLSHGWHMLNQARIALVEAEACKIFYEEIQSNHTEALYRSLYYLDDAALRLHSSSEHMLRSVIFRWTLGVTEEPTGVGASDSPKERREWQSLLVRVIKKAQQSREAQDVTKLLRCLRSSEAWKACMKHRHDWVHNRLPAINGIFPDIRFGTIDFDKELPPVVRKAIGLKKGVSMSFGVGQNISVVRETVRNAYGELFRVYEGLAKLLAKDGESTQ